MTISFISIQGNESSGWDVIQKKFPKVSRSSITLSFTSVTLDKHCADQKTAEVAAKQIAELKKLPYASENASVITVTLFCGYYLPVELTPSGRVICLGTNSPSLESAIKEARIVAESRNLLFMCPCGGENA